MEEAERLLDQARNCGINAFTLTGGEPMLHKYFFDIVEGIYARGMYVEELNTNGHYINQRALDRLKAHRLHAADQDLFRRHRLPRLDARSQGRGAGRLRAAALCIENGFRVKVQTNMNRRNCDVMLQTAELFDAMGVEEIRMIRTTEAPRWVQNAGDATLTLAEYYDASIEIWKQYAAGDHSMPLTIWQFGTLYPQTRSYSLTAVNSCAGTYRDSAPVCKGNRGMIAVAANGNVFPAIRCPAITSSTTTASAMSSKSRCPNC